MQLEKWIEEENKTQQEVAEALGTTQGCVSRWCAGTAIPRPKMMTKIIDLTSGKVTANDFFEGNR